MRTVFRLRRNISRLRSELQQTRALLDRTRASNRRLVEEGERLRYESEHATPDGLYIPLSAWAEWDPNEQVPLEIVQPQTVHAAQVNESLWGPACHPALRWTVPLVATGEFGNAGLVTCSSCIAAAQPREA